MWGNDTKDSRESIGQHYPSMSVAEILYDMGLAYPVVSQFPIGESLTQVILFPQEVADLHFFLMKLMFMASARTTTPSTKTTSCCTDASWTPAMGQALLISLKNAIETPTSKAKPQKSGAKKNTKSKSKRSKQS